MGEPQRFAILVGETNVLFELTPEDHALFVSIGMAVAQMQLLETSLSSIAGGLETWTKADDGRWNRTGEPEPDLSDRTLGQLIGIVRHYVGREEIVARLETARKARNRVAHNILKEFGWPFLNTSQYFDAVREINEATAQMANAETTIRQFVAMTRPFPNYTAVIDREAKVVRVSGPSGTSEFPLPEDAAE